MNAELSEAELLAKSFDYLYEDGYCGENVTWGLTEDGTLTITLAPYAHFLIAHQYHMVREDCCTFQHIVTYSLSTTPYSF